VGLAVQGSVLDRFFLDVDYDQTREFTDANRIGITYLGRPGETLRSVEVGDVSFDLPRSRFLTRGIPAGNLGLRAVAGLGPVALEGVWAQQRGGRSSAEFRFAGLAGGGGFVQRDTLVVDDADYVQGQFFFLSDPRLITGYPHIDVLSLDGSEAPASVIPGPSPIQLYRFETDAFTRQQVEGYIQANAVAGLGPDTVAEGGWFRTLEPSVDYEVHASGLWVSLRRPLRNDEMLAVAYVAQSGDTVGDYNPERLYNAGSLPTLRLLRASAPNHQPGRPTWDTEMHQVYRVSGSTDVDPTSVRIVVSLGEVNAGRTFAREEAGSAVTYLRLFGLDEASPADEVDQAALYRPAEESVGLQPAVSGTFVIFPTLRPFAQPPPVPSLGLTSEQTAALLGEQANPVIYDDPDPVERAGGGLFRLTAEYTVRSRGLATAFSLGGLGVRENSERIYLGPRLLQRGRDYEIDYDLGEIRLLDPSGLLGTAPGASIRATWEERSVFQIAPISVFGLGAKVQLQDRGSLNFIGLYQNQKEIVRRPQLGVEPSSLLLAGVNGEFRFTGDWLDRALRAIPGGSGGEQAELTVSGELAISSPNPNTSGDVFLDDFDAANQLRLPRLASGWRLGSAPTELDGAELVLPPLDVAHAGDLVWQHTWVRDGVQGDSVFLGFFPTVDIDRQIEVTGSDTREPGLLLTFQDSTTTADQEPLWRSITATLNATGLDLSKSEFIEFYAADGDSVTLVLDLGRVSEDAYFVNGPGSTSGSKSDGSAWGLGRLDQEADPRRGQVWSPARDAVGVWGEGCLAERAEIYRVGDVRANCTRGNGRPDTEDLDGDGALDTEERIVRYVVPLDASSPYLARSRSETGTAFRLYRIPLRGPGAIDVGGLFGEADWRGVRHLRMTVVGPPQARVILARFNVVGTQWVRRGETGVLRGLGGDTLALSGQAEVASISRVTVGDRYEAPPGVLAQLDDPASALGGQGVEFNERSLGLRFTDLDPGARMEAFNRFAQRPRSFLEYREARLWVSAAEGAFGAGQPLYFFLKVGSDSENFYLYRTRLPAPSPTGQVTESDWLPEVVVDFDVWLELRRRAEIELITNPRGPGEGPLEVWSADSTYAVVLQDRAQAPVLAAVRELSMGVWNQSGLPVSGEVWVDELRLGRSVRDVGVAGHIDVTLRKGDVFETQLVIAQENPFFRQLQDQPTYRNETSVSIRSQFQVGALLPASWGLEAPIVVSRALSGQDPVLLAQSDIRASRLAGLREPSTEETRLGFAFRKRTRSDRLLGRVLLDGLDASLAYSTGGVGTVTSDADRNAVDARVGYRWEMAERGVSLVPGALEGVVRTLLPQAWEERLLDARLRWSPERMSVTTAYSDQDGRITRFDQIVTQPSDALFLPLATPVTSLDTSADLALRPFRSFSAEVAFLTARDLLDPTRAVSDPRVQSLITAERSRVLGVDLGWETRRALTTRFAFQPRFGEWARADLSVDSRYGSDRDPAYVELRPLVGDTLFLLERTVDGGRDLSATVTVLPAEIGERLRVAADSGAIGGLLRAMSPVRLAWRRGARSRFNRQTVDPGWDYQFGFLGLDQQRVIDGQVASVLSDRETWTAGTGVRLPGLATLTVNFQQANSDVADRRSERTAFDRTWPNARLAFDDLPVPGAVRPLLRRVGLSGGYTRTSRRIEYGGASAQSRDVVDTRYPMDVSVSWGGLVNTTYRGVVAQGVGEDPTGDTRRDLGTHTFALQSAVVPPGRLAEFLEAPVQVSLQLLYSHQVDCRATVGTPQCVAFIDQLNRSLNVTLDSRVSDLRVGMQMGFLDRQSFVGLRNGTRQFQMSLFGQFDVGARLFSDGS